MDHALTHRLAVGLCLSLLATPVVAQDAGQVTSVARVYDVADLTGHDRVRTPAGATPAGTHRPSREERAPQRAHPSAANADETATTLVEFIRTWITPSLAGIEGGAQEIDWTAGGHLIVLGNASHHEWIEAFLHTQRQRPEPVELRTRLLSVPLDGLDAVGLVVGGEARIVGVDEGRALTARLQLAGAQQLVAPALVTFPRQRGSVSVLDQQSYVVGWSLERVMPGPTLLADPQVEVITEGSMLEVTAAPLPDGTYGLDVFLSVSRLEQPVPATETELHPSLPTVTYSLPTVSKAEAWTRAALVPESAMLFGARDPHHGDAVVVLIELDLPDLSGSPR